MKTDLVCELEKHHRVCLIVDNPLRDIDGLVLLAWQLAKKGIDAYLVPMYNQMFDVFAISPDVVVVNYVRANNVDYLKRFHKAGIRVAVLDTEGNPGKSMDVFANLVGQLNCNEFITDYFLWGSDQYAAFLRNDTLAAERMHITGCPRYDFCAEPLCNGLPDPGITSGYVLINTTFPISNPRFTISSEEEYKTMVKLGYEKKLARQFVEETRIAHCQTIEIIQRLVDRYPNKHFVLRPHPFENSRAYLDAIDAKNFEIRQEGTSLQWINRAKFVVHLNCSTALEAVLLGKEPISLEWINPPTLAAHALPNVSRQPDSEIAFYKLVDQMLDDTLPPADERLIAERDEFIRSRYHANDGMAAVRIAELIQYSLLKQDSCGNIDRMSVKFNLKQIMRMIFGYKLFNMVRRLIDGGKSDLRRKAKLFTFAEVSAIVARLNKILGCDHRIYAVYADKGHSRRPSMLSGQSIRITQRAHELDTAANQLIRSKHNRTLPDGDKLWDSVRAMDYHE